MKTNEHITKVIFRKCNEFGEIFALFPDTGDNWSNGLIDSYASIGQHSGADYNHCIKTSKPASQKEYADLKTELESIGYNLLVRHLRR